MQGSRVLGGFLVRKAICEFNVHGPNFDTLGAALQPARKIIQEVQG